MLASVASDWGPTIVGTLAILSGLATSIYVTRAQSQARRQDHQHQLTIAHRSREHDITIRGIEYEQERERRLEDETLTAAAQLAGTLTAISSGLHLIRTARAAEDLDTIEELLKDGQNQEGHLSLLLGDRHPVVSAAASALLRFNYAHGWARQEHDPEQDPEAASGAAATAKKESYLADASRAMQEFWLSAREAGIAAKPRE